VCRRNNAAALLSRLMHMRGPSTAPPGVGANRGGCRAGPADARKTSTAPSVPLGSGDQERDRLDGRAPDLLPNCRKIVRCGRLSTGCPGACTAQWRSTGPRLPMISPRRQQCLWRRALFWARRGRSPSNFRKSCACFHGLSAAELQHGPRAALSARTPVFMMRLMDETAATVDALAEELRESSEYSRQ